MSRESTIRSDEQLLPDKLIPEPQEDGDVDEIGPSETIIIAADLCSTLAINQENIRRCRERAYEAVTSTRPSGPIGGAEAC